MARPTHVITSGGYAARIGGGRAIALALAVAVLAILAFFAIRDAAGSRVSGGLPAAIPAPVVKLPPGFAPVVRYRERVKDFRFSGSSLPVGWSASAGDNHGFQATMFQPSRVRMTGSSAALSAVNQSLWGYPYQSGWISTEGSFSMSYGMVDFRAKMPAGQGLWSGLWLDQPDHSYPWGEIDVQEMLLGDTHTIYGSLHNWAPSPDWSELQSTYMAADASQGFHDYQVIAQPGLITWAVDGVAYAQYTRAQAAAAGEPWPFADGSGFFLIADLAVAGASEWGGPPTASTVFPATMRIQSVRVWE
jgi:beta-glucanase (GH16 family)